jgi:uncharacterized protein involved in exopolysaccharide biosynthesis
MGKVDRKRKKLVDRIEQLQSEMTNALTKKDSNTSEISISDYQRKITEAKMRLAELQ